MAEVRLEGVCKRFGANEVLSDLSLTIRDGEFFAIVGPSGCGKSTLLNLLAGLDTPSAGRIVFDGENVTEQEPRERDVALVFQSYALYPHMRVRDNLSFPLRVAGRTSDPDRRGIDEEVRRIAGMLGLESLLDRWPRELSGGQRQRVALGRALIRRPRVFLLDEPLSNLDAQLRASMRAELRRLHDQLGTTMIYVTHDQTEAMTLADRVAVLDRGRIRQVGAPRELYDRPRTLFVAAFIGYPRINVLPAILDDRRLKSGSLDLPSPPVVAGTGLREGVRLMVGIRPEHIRIVPREAGEASSEQNGRQMEGVLRLLEHTGGQTWATVEIGGSPDLTTVVGFVPPGVSLRPGQAVAGLIEDERFHLFDAETEFVVETGKPV